MQKLNFIKLKNLSDIGNAWMPNMADTLTSWLSDITLIKVTQDIAEGDLVETREEVTFRGVWQPLTDKQLELKPEGQRAWSWYWIHAKSEDIELNVSDKVIFRDKTYKVMTVKDYSLDGYRDYHVVRDYDETILEDDTTGD